MSPFSVHESIDRLEALLRAKGVRIFARIDQQDAAQSAGLVMPPMEVLIFGNPKAGTPILLAAPEAGIELPVRVMAWQASDGAVKITFNDPAYLRSRFGLSEELVGAVSVAGGLIDAALRA